MNTEILATEPIREISPLFRARAAGLFWLLTILTSMFAFLAGGKFVVSGDAVATATNLLAHESTYRWAFLANITATLCYLAVTLLLYALLRPVSRDISLLGAFFSITGCAMGAVSCLFFLAPLTLLGGAQYLSAFPPGQLQAQALSFLTLSALANDIALVFFAFHVLTVGHLIRRSLFLPRILGALLAITGFCYLANSAADFLSLPFKVYLLPFVAAGGLLGEGSLTVWLLAKGVNVPLWKEQARRQRN